MTGRLSYIRALFAPETDKMASLRATATGNDAIGILPEEGKLLQILIRLAGVKTIVEIGALHGYSALWMQAAMPPDGKIYTFEKDDARAALAEKNLAAEKNISLIKGDALKMLATIEPAAPFDMIFIDGDKLHYTAYLDWAEKYIRKDGLIIGDNTLLFDSVWHDDPVERVRPAARAAMRAFNLRLSDAQKYTSLLFPTEEGLTIAIKNF